MSEQRIRPSAVAGTFYPARASELRRVVRGMLAEASAALEDDGTDSLAPTKAMIVPHAGFVYSGPVAASAYARLARERDRIERVILFGPCHRVWVEGLAASSADAFETPFGLVPVDREAVERALALPQVQRSDRAHQTEHSLEVQLPFLQEVLGTFTFAPFAVGGASGAEVAEVIELLWGGPETVILISSDLSHYLEYDEARRMDAGTSRAIESLDASGVTEDGACGRISILGMIDAAKRHGLTSQILDVRNSGDTAGPRGEVVGYGAYRFS